MFGTDKSLKAQVLAAGVALSALVGLVGAGYANSSASTAEGLAQCDIAATKTGSTIALEGLVYAEENLQGTYRFTVKSAGGAGSTNIAQGGGFVVNAQDSAVLGQMNLGGSGVTYDAWLEIEIDGTVFDCRSRIGAAL